MSGLDPAIVQDFLTESGELLEQLDQDLVVLEQNVRDSDLLNRIFRALHTIKGSASFLALTELVAIAHVAESALNAARNGQVVVDRAMMDLLLQATDLLKRQFAALAAGEPLPAPPADLVEALRVIGEGGGTDHAAPGAAAPAANGPPRLDLPPGKVELVEFLVKDLETSVVKMNEHAQALASGADRVEAAAGLATHAEELGRAVEFFGIGPVSDLARALGEAAQVARTSAVTSVEAIAGEIRRMIEALSNQAAGIAAGEVRPCDVAALEAGLRSAAGGGEGGGDAGGGDAGGGGAAGSAGPAPGASAEHEPAAPAPVESAGGAHPPAKSAGGASAATADSTIRVEIARLEALLNLVGELVLQKNRVVALARQAVAQSMGTQDYRESVTQAIGGLERTTGDIQTAVMRTRLQPLDKLFGRYPRVIRDLARKTNKEIQLVIEGGDTEVDKSVIEELADPLVHLLRNSADHGVEPPADREGAGKPRLGTIRLVAENQGGHVSVRIIDDGRGLSRERIGAKAVERGLVTEQRLSEMTDREVWNFIFAAGFSTAAAVSDLSGRGVGMDVVKTNIEKIKGTVELSSEPGKSTTVTVKIPLTVAILPAMMVGVGANTYAVPLSHVVEIVKPGPADVSTITSSPVMRLRDSVLPLLDARQVFGESGGGEAPFAVVLDSLEKRVGLLVTRLIGQQEIVIKPLDEMTRCHGPVAGATVRDDGGVSLIVDVPRLIADAEEARGAGGAGGVGGVGGAGRRGQ